MNERQSIREGFKAVLIAHGYCEADAGFLAVGAETDVHETVLELADQEKNEADARYPMEDDSLSDAEADAMTLASAGMGTDEDYGGWWGETD